MRSVMWCLHGSLHTLQLIKGPNLTVSQSCGLPLMLSWMYTSGLVQQIKAGRSLHPPG
jgi:hypothetical protein